jgi:hypothetical protein
VPQETILTVAAVITALGIIIGAVVATYRLVNRIGDAIGVDDKGRTLSDRLDRVEHQLWPNGGSSLADQVKQIHVDSVANTSKLDLIQDLLSAATTAKVAGSSPAEVAPAAPKRRRKVA